MLDAARSEKERVLRRRNRFRQAAALFRYLLEAIAAVVVISWFSARLPAAMAAISELRRLLSFLLHPACAFVAGNAIIVALIRLPRGAAVKETIPNPEVEFHVQRSKSVRVRPVARKEGVEKLLRRSATAPVRRRLEEEDDERFRMKIEEFIAKKKMEFIEREEVFLQIAGLESDGAAGALTDGR